MGLGIVAGFLLRLLGAAALDLDVPWRRWGRRRRAPAPVRPSIESLAHTIERLAAEHVGSPGRTWVKTEAVRHAYDDALTEGCRALSIETDLTELAPGLDRDAERIRVEYELTEAGLIRRSAA